MSVANGEFWQGAVSIGESMIAGDDVWSQYARAQLAALLMSEGITPLRAPGAGSAQCGHLNPPAQER
jgi:hypothetical protein